MGRGRGRGQGTSAGCRGGRGRGAAAAKKAVAAKCGEASGSCGTVDETSPGKRTLERRNSYERAERAVNTRLVPVYGAAQVNGAVDEQGNKIIDLAVEEVRTMKKATQNLKKGFWNKIIEQFKLKKLTSITVDLPDPDDNEDEPRIELQSALKCFHSENPATRKVEPLEQFFQYCRDPLTYTEYYGTIMATFESVTVTHSFMIRAQMAILKHMANMEDFKRFPVLFERMRGIFNAALNEFYESKFSRKRSMQEKFLRLHKGLLEMFTDKKDLEHVSACFVDNKDPTAEIYFRLVRACTCLASLFKKMATKMDVSLFKLELQQRLDDLEHLDFPPEEVENFKNIMTHKVQELTDGGYTLYGRQKDEQGRQKDEIVSFMGASLSDNTVMSLNDLWYRHLFARLKTAAVNSGLVSKLPFEEDNYKDGKIPDAPETAKIHSSVLEKIQLVRDEILHDFKEDNCTDVESQRVSMLKHLDDYRELDPSIDLEYSFLKQHALPLKLACLQEKILDIVPSGTPLNYTKVLDALEALSISRSCTLERKLKTEVSGVKNMITALKDGQGPDCAECNNMSDFYKLAVSRLQFFFHLTFVAPGSVGPLAEGKQLCGKNALLHAYETTKAEIEGGGTKSPGDLQDLRRFSWLLEKNQVAMVDKWMQDACTVAVGRKRALTSGAASTIDEADTKKKKSSFQAIAVATSASSSSKPHASTMKIASSPQATKMDTSGPNILKYFKKGCSR